MPTRFDVKKKDVGKALEPGGVRADLVIGLLLLLEKRLYGLQGR